MRQYRKGRRLLALNEQKMQAVQRQLAKLQTHRKELIEQIKAFDVTLANLRQALIGLHIQDESVVRADIYRQRKKQVVLLHERQQAMVERGLRREDLAAVELDISMYQKQAVDLKRKEAKFTRWMQHGKQQATQKQNNAIEDENQEQAVLR